MTSELEALLHLTTLCNLASVKGNEEMGKCQTMGEIALPEIAYRFDHDKKSL